MKELRFTPGVKKMRLHSGGVTLENGFTLVEILVVIAIIAIVGTMLVAIFYSTLRGSNKAQILAIIKQNGQAVLENMDKTIRDADNVACNSLDGATLVIVKNGIYTRYRFFPPSASTNGVIQQDNPVQPASGNNSDIKLFKDNVCSDPMGTDSPVVNTLTDINTLSGISVENGSFTRDKPAGFKDQITVKFDLRPGVSVPASISGQIDPVSFQTAIQLR